MAAVMQMLQIDEGKYQALQLPIVFCAIDTDRLILETTEAVAAAIGADRVGIRLCPYNTWMDATDTVERAMAKNIYLVQELQKRVPGMAYIHMVSTFSLN